MSGHSFRFSNAKISPARRFILILLFAFFSTPLLVKGAVSVGAISHKNSGANTSLTLPVSGDTWTHTVSGSDTILIVGVSINQTTASESVSTITYNGKALTHIGTAVKNNNIQVELWYRLAPDAGTHNVIVTLNAVARFVAGAILFTGVDQTTPLGTFVGNSGNSKSASVSISSAVDELVVDIMGYPDSNVNANVGSGQTQQWTDETASGTSTDDAVGYSSTEGGAASVTMSWSIGSKRNWAIGGVSIKPSTSAFGYRKQITIDRTKVGVTGTSTTTLSNFPLLLSFTDANLQSTARGGHVNSLSGYDIIFRGVDDGVCGGAGTNPCTLDHQIEKYDESTGQLIAWVRLPSVNTIAASSNTVIYMYYGNPSVTSSLENKNGAWDANYKSVWHLSDNAATTTVEESTSNNNDGTSYTNTSSKTTAGMINTALSFSGNNGDIVYTTNAFNNPQNMTISAWAKTGTASGKKIVGLEDQPTGTGSTYYDRMLWVSTDGKAYAGCYSLTYGFFTVASNSAVNDNNWHYIVALVNDTGNVLRIYVDGSLNNSITVGEGCQNYGRNAYYRIGGYKTATWTNGVDGYFPGSIDEVRLSTTIRGADWIKSEYNNQYSPSTFYSIGTEQQNPITLIQLISFTAENYLGLVQLQWKTGYEIDNLGFRLYRENKGKLIRITPSMIAGSALLARNDIALTSGRTYVWQDMVGSSSVPLRYWLEDVDTLGKSTWHGPAIAAAGEPALPQQVRSMVLSALGKGASKTQSNTSSWRYSRNNFKQLSYSALSSLTLGSFSADGPTSDGSLSAFSSYFKTPKSFATNLRWRRAVKILVNKEGWYRITQPQLVQAGLSTFADSTRLQLFAEGVEQPIFVSSRFNHRNPPVSSFITGNVQKISAWKSWDLERLRFGEKDWIEFYGTGLNTPWSETKVYWLVEGDQAGKRITATRGTSILSSTTSLPATIELNPKTIYWAGLLNGDGDNFFGSVVSSEGDDEFFQLNHLDELATAGGRLEIGLQGVSEINHSVQVRVNGVNVGSLAFSSQTSTSAFFNLPWGLLLPGQNYINLIALNGEEDISLVHFIRVTYWRVLDADENTLSIEADANQAVILGGFSTPDIRVMDVTDPLAVREIIGVPFQQSNGYSITVSAPGSGSRKLLAFANSQVQSPAAIEPYQRSNWNSMTSGADVIIISHPDFMQSLMPLKAQQEAEGYTVALANVNDLYDEFSYGEKTPYALKFFIAKALRDWYKKPRFLILAGDASFDPNNYLGLGDFDYVPTKLIDTDQLETASDDWFADSNNDGIPEIAVGRISGRTDNEIAIQVAKIVAYKQMNAGSQNWAKNFVLVADSNDGYDFEAASDQLPDLTPNLMSVSKIYRGQMDAWTARTQILQSLNAGALLINYYGHGSVDLWRGDLLTSNDPPLLANGTRLPLVIAMTCLNGFFADIYTESLAEALMKAPYGGAVAVWASSGMTDAQFQQVMNEEFFRQLFNYNQTVGEAVMKSKAAGSDLNVRKTWIFFGDPTMKLAGFNQPSYNTPYNNQTVNNQTMGIVVSKPKTTVPELRIPEPKMSEPEVSEPKVSESNITVIYEPKVSEPKAQQKYRNILSRREAR